MDFAEEFSHFEIAQLLKKKRIPTVTRNIYIAVAAVLVLLCGGVLFVYYHLSGHKQSSSLSNRAIEIEREPRKEFPGFQKPVSKNPNSPEADKTLLRYCDWGKLDEVRAALAAGADVNTADRITGETALMLAAKSGHVDIVEELLVRGADVNRKANNGRTALDLAEKFKQPETARLLQEQQRASEN